MAFQLPDWSRALIRVLIRVKNAVLIKPNYYYLLLRTYIVQISTLIKALDQSGGWKAMLYLLVYILPVNNAPFTR